MIDDLNTKIANLESKGKSHNMVVKDSGAEDKFARPDKKNRRLEVSAEAKKFGGSYEKKVNILKIVFQHARVVLTFQLTLM